LPALDLRREAGLLARFGGVGVVTTLVGGAVIMTLDVGLHLDRRLANTVGFVVGVGLSFLLQGRFVFRGEGRREGLVWRYLVAIATAFAVNQGVLGLAGAVLPQAAYGRATAQLLAMGSYTVTQFVLLRLWVFRPAKA
jgi:putative flippase GtrA